VGCQGPYVIGCRGDRTPDLTGHRREPAEVEPVAVGVEGAAQLEPVQAGMAVMDAVQIERQGETLQRTGEP
jgi:hypothetical protein